jgi:hypothetical protein
LKIYAAKEKGRRKAPSGRMLRGKDHRRKIKAAKRIRGKNRTAGKNPLRQTNFKGREKNFTRHRVFYRE